MVQKSGTGVPIQQYLSHDAYLHAVSAALAAELGAGGGEKFYPALRVSLFWRNDDRSRHAGRKQHRPNCHQSG